MKIIKGYKWIFGSQRKWRPEHLNTHLDRGANVELTTSPQISATTAFFPCTLPLFCFFDIATFQHCFGSRGGSEKAVPASTRVLFHLHSHVELDQEWKVHQFSRSRAPEYRRRPEPLKLNMVGIQWNTWWSTLGAGEASLYSGDYCDTNIDLSRGPIVVFCCDCALLPWNIPAFRVKIDNSSYIWTKASRIQATEL